MAAPSFADACILDRILDAEGGTGMLLRRNINAARGLCNGTPSLRAAPLRARRRRAPSAALHAHSSRTPPALQIVRAEYMADFTDALLVYAAAKVRAQMTTAEAKRAGNSLKRSWEIESGKEAVLKQLKAASARAKAASVKAAQDDAALEEEAALEELLSCIADPIA